jgi:hypothetical protein
MAERVLPENLSGEEIRTAILDKLMVRLAKDGHLNAAHSYDHFSYEIEIHIELHDLGRIEKVDVKEAGAPVKLDPENPEYAALEQFETELAGAQTDPNTMREETGQAVPVLTKDQDGKPSIGRIKYPRPKR